MDRLQLDQVLRDILGTDHVYFQPPNGLTMVYPCIVYKRDYGQTDFANDQPYLVHKRYMVTVIDKNPDSPTPDKIAQLPMSVFNRFYTADGLNHDVYNVFV